MAIRSGLVMCIVGTLVAPASLAALTSDDASADRALPEIVPNQNRVAAGVRQGESVVLTLRAARGVWRPEGPAGPALEIEAFGEEAAPLQVPAPLIRVPEGTAIVVSIRNDLQSPLQVQGLCVRDGTACAAVHVPPSGQREVRFPSGRAGTYHYWATTTGMPLDFRGSSDTQLSGALIVDPAERAPASDRVLVITEWTSITRDQLKQLAAADDPGAAFEALAPRFTFLINGLSWPATERLRYRLGEDVHWRVINLSTQVHPMHLHGFYFRVDSLGDGRGDARFEDGHQPRVVTQLLKPGATMEITWRPDREGNWLFHCHIAAHISPERSLREDSDAHAGQHAHGDSAGMAGMVLGVTVVKTDVPPDAPEAPGAETPRRLTLIMKSEPQRYGSLPGLGFALAGDDTESGRTAISIPGPLLILQRGQPVEIVLINQLPMATAIHWHGMELDSYYDGVHGWSGVGTHVTPLIEPGKSFLVRFTPPRAGTFMYHTHLHDNLQLESGMYGPLLVLEPGEAFDPLIDHVVVISRGGPESGAPTVLSGSTNQQFVWKAGERHRIRFINITPGDVFVTSIAGTAGPVEWRPIAKDGTSVATAERALHPATQAMAVGETFDFEYDAPRSRQSLWINVSTPAGRWVVQARVTIK